jgi:hypothetical protein
LVVPGNGMCLHPSGIATMLRLDKHICGGPAALTGCGVPRLGYERGRTCAGAGLGSPCVVRSRPFPGGRHRTRVSPHHPRPASGPRGQAPPVLPAASRESEVQR